MNIIQDSSCSRQHTAEELFKALDDSSLEYCLPQKTRVILIVIDALKYDFGLFDPSKYAMTASHYHNNNSNGGDVFSQAK